MGHFPVAADLTGPTGVVERLELLVDTGATFLTIPRAVAERLDLRPTRIASIQVAGGIRARWPLADVRLTLGAGTGLLGAVALETLLLAVDPVPRRLVPTDGYAMPTRLPRPLLTTA